MFEMDSLSNLFRTNFTTNFLCAFGKITTNNDKQNCKRNKINYKKKIAI